MKFKKIEAKRYDIPLKYSFKNAKSKTILQHFFKNNGCIVKIL